MLNIYLFKVTKKLNSTERPATNTAYLTLTGALKDPTSLVNPTLLIDSSSDLSLVNYCYVSDLHRYYWVNDIVYNRGIYELRCSVDVLATYKTAIGATSMYVTRSSKQKNGTIRDDLYPVTGSVSYSYTDITSPAIGGYKDGYYVVSTIGNTNNAGETIYQMNVTQYNTVMQELFANANGFSWGGLGQGVINSLMNQTDYIVSAYWFPTAFATISGGDTKFRCGPWESTTTVPVVANSQSATITSVSVPSHPQAATRGSYMNAAPFSQYCINLGLAGTFELDSTKLMDTTAFTLSIHPDPLTGQAKIIGSKISSQDELFNLTVNYGVPLNIAMGKNNILSTITDIAQVGASIATKRYDQAAVGIASSIGDLAGTFAGSVSNTGSVGSITNHILRWRLMARFFNAADDDNANRGRPLCTVTTPATLLGGYIQAEDVHLAIDATVGELQQMKALIEGGFYYE